MATIAAAPNSLDAKIHGYFNLNEKLRAQVRSCVRTYTKGHVCFRLCHYIVRIWNAFLFLICMSTWQRAKRAISKSYPDSDISPAQRERILTLLLEINTLQNNPEKQDLLAEKCKQFDEEFPPRSTETPEQQEIKKEELQFEIKETTHDTLKTHLPTVVAAQDKFNKAKEKGAVARTALSETTQGARAAATKLLEKAATQAKKTQAALAHPFATMRAETLKENALKESYGQLIAKLPLDEEQKNNLTAVTRLLAQKNVDIVSELERFNNEEPIFAVLADYLPYMPGFIDFLEKTKDSELRTTTLCLLNQSQEELGSDEYFQLLTFPWKEIKYCANIDQANKWLSLVCEHHKTPSQSADLFKVLASIGYNKGRDDSIFKFFGILTRFNPEKEKDFIDLFANWSATDKEGFDTFTHLKSASLAKKAALLRALSAFAIKDLSTPFFTVPIVIYPSLIEKDKEGRRVLGLVYTHFSSQKELLLPRLFELSLKKRGLSEFKDSEDLACQTTLNRFAQMSAEEWKEEMSSSDDIEFDDSASNQGDDDETSSTLSGKARKAMSEIGGKSPLKNAKQSLSDLGKKAAPLVPGFRAFREIAQGVAEAWTELKHNKL